MPLQTCGRRHLRCKFIGVTAIDGDRDALIA
jgi:hypothetical protein